MASETLHTKVTADGSQAKAEMGALQRAVEGLGTAGEKMAEMFSGALDGLRSGFKSAQDAMGALQTGLGYLEQGIQAAADVESFRRLEAALPTASVERLTEASQGLFAQADLLRLGVKGLTGDFAITDDQMAKVVQASIALSQKGFGPAAQIADKLVDALHKGVNKLDDYGIRLEKTGDFQADVNNAMEAFNGLIADSKPVDARAASIAQMQRNIEAATLAIKEMMAAVTNLVAEGVNGLASIREWWKATDERDAQLASMSAADFMGRDFNAAVWNAGRRQRGLRQVPSALTATDEGYAANLGVGYDEDLPFNQRWAPPPEVVTPGKKGKGPRRSSNDGAAWDYVYGAAAENPFLAIDPFDTTYRVNATDVGEREIGGAKAGKKGKSILEAFGLDAGTMDAGLKALRAKAEEFKSVMDGLKMAGEGFAQAMASGFTAAIKAAIDGEASIGQALLKATSERMKSMAIEAGGQAVYHGAMAIGRAAFGDVAGASLHAAAAAEFGVAAAALGAGGYLLGKGVSGKGGAKQASSAGGGFARPATNGNAGGGGVTVNVNFGAGFVGKPDEVAALVGQAVRDSYRKGVRVDSTTKFRG